MSTSFSSRVPVPGPLFGTYPQRLKHREQGDLVDRVVKLGKRVITGWKFSSSTNKKFVADVRRRSASLASPGSDEFVRTLSQVRAQLALVGFEGEALRQGLAHSLKALSAAAGIELYDTQLLAARIMLSNRLAEMATGEGKTFAMFAAASVAALAGVPVHVVTANDYLAARDADDLRSAFQLLGLQVTALHGDIKPDQRAAVYRHHVVYGAAREFIFDYLLDRSKLQSATASARRTAQQFGSEPSMRGLCLALIDEADSVLIDEARTPFILAADHKDPEEAKAFGIALSIAKSLEQDRHFSVDAARRHVSLSEQGKALACERATLVGGLWSKNSGYREELVQLGLTAVHLYQRGVDYVVTAAQGDTPAQVELIDTNSGRIAKGRKLGNGLHQLIECKEGLPPTNRQHTFAQLTFQRFFIRYHRLGGMSGTIQEAASEIDHVYGIKATIVPLRLPSQRQNLGTRVYRQPRQRWRAVVQLVRKEHKTGRPVLIGTDSLSDSEQLSQLLKLSGVTHQVLNATQSANEAQCVQMAGNVGAVTVATNMAGRGTDIKLDKRALKLGGLLVISCQMNSEARIDRQLYGRSARQGDPGQVCTLLSLNEGMLARHIPPRVRTLIDAGFKSDRALPNWLCAFLVRFVQHREGRFAREQRKLLAMQDEMYEKQLAVGGFGI